MNFVYFMTMESIINNADQVSWMWMGWRLSIIIVGQLSTCIHYCDFTRVSWRPKSPTDCLFNSMFPFRVVFQTVGNKMWLQPKVLMILILVNSWHYSTIISFDETDSGPQSMLAACYSKGWNDINSHVIGRDSNKSKAMKNKNSYEIKYLYMHIHSGVVST